MTTESTATLSVAVGAFQLTLALVAGGIQFLGCTEGHDMRGGSVSTTVTLNEHETEFPTLFVYVLVTVVVPNGYWSLRIVRTGRTSVTTLTGWAGLLLMFIGAANTPYDLPRAVPIMFVALAAHVMFGGVRSKTVSGWYTMILKVQKAVLLAASYAT